MKPTPIQPLGPKDHKEAYMRTLNDTIDAMHRRLIESQKARQQLQDTLTQLSKEGTYA